MAQDKHKTLQKMSQTELQNRIDKNTARLKKSRKINLSSEQITKLKDEIIACKRILYERTTNFCIQDCSIYTDVFDTYDITNQGHIILHDVLHGTKL